MTIDQVKVIEIGADAIEKVFRDQPLMAMTYPPKLMHAVVAALGRHGFIIEDRYEEEAGPVPPVLPADLPKWPTTSPVDLTERLQTLGKTAADWEVEGDDA